MPHVLVVEDSRLYANVLRRQIEGRLRMPVTHTASLAETEELLEGAHPPFLVGLLDLHLPDGENGEVIDLVSEKGIPSVVFTGEFSKATHDFVWSKRIVDYVLKEGPHSVDYLTTLIEQLHRNQRIKLLVVDDSRVGRRHMQELLLRHQYQVLLASDGVMALELLEKNPDIMLVLTDYNMPRMDGFELITRLRANFGMDQLAIIGLSSQGDEELAVRFIKQGANDFISKPHINDQLYCRVQQNIRLIQRFHELAAQSEALAKEVDERKRAESAVQESEFRYRMLVELLPQPVVVEKEQTIVFLNQAVMRLLASEERERVLGRSLVEFVAEKDRMMVAEFIETAQRQGGTTDNLEAEFLRMDGAPLYVSLRGTCVLYEGTVGVQLALTDITDQREREMKLDALSRRDGLTGLANRRALDERIAIEWKRAQQDGMPIGLVMIDVDFFKRYNDSLGHQQGDDCLARVAGALRDANKRSSDLVARYGGEEFAVLLPEVTTVGALRIGERLRAGVADLRMSHPDSAVGPNVTISLGVSVMQPAPGDSADTLLESADRALYEAKRTGRNRVCLADDAIED